MGENYNYLHDSQKHRISVIWYQTVCLSLQVSSILEDLFWSMHAFQGYKIWVSTPNSGQIFMRYYITNTAWQVNTHTDKLARMWDPH